MTVARGTAPSRRSSQALPTALQEVVDAQLAAGVLCVLHDEDHPSYRAAQLRLDHAVYAAIEVGATASQIEVRTR
ncbi:hypothetical protein [Georgenia wangjunii]|uniref:hypothetical protein n=1 Tax=Georgenia wangjunii TaxID=3117730 RepID=UPI002F25FBCA